MFKNGIDILTKKTPFFYMISKKFIITQSEGKNFSLESGDNNKIHIDQNYAYNSIFGKKICFGSQILIKILKIIDISFEQNLN